jgi:hypothetical protein
MECEHVGPSKGEHADGLRLVLRVHWHWPAVRAELEQFGLLVILDCVWYRLTARHLDSLLRTADTGWTGSRSVCEAAVL